MFITCFTFFNCKQSDPIETEFTLVWEDQFDGTEIDAEKWEFQIGDGANYGLWGWGNNEKAMEKHGRPLNSKGKQ